MPPLGFEPTISAGERPQVYASSFKRFLGHTRRTRVGRNPLGEWSASRRDLYLTTHNTHNRQTSMPTAGTQILSRRATVDLRRRSLGQWDRCVGISNLFLTGQVSTAFTFFSLALFPNLSPNLHKYFPFLVTNEMSVITTRLRAQLLAYTHQPSYPIRIANHAPLRWSTVR